MNVVVIDRGNLVTKRIRDELIRRAHGEFSPFASRIRRVSIVFEDEGSPQNGVERGCRLAVRLQNWGELIVQTWDDNVARAFSRGINRMRLAIKRNVKRQSVEPIGADRNELTMPEKEDHR